MPNPGYIFPCTPASSPDIQESFILAAGESVSLVTRLGWMPKLKLIDLVFRLAEQDEAKIRAEMERL